MKLTRILPLILVSALACNSPKQEATTEAAPVQPTAADVAFTANGVDFERLVSQFEHGLLRRALEHAGGNRRAAADLLKIKRTTLIEKLKRLERS